MRNVQTGGLACFLFSFFVFSSFAQEVLPGHAHNDYTNHPPLFRALENGLISVEADIHLMKGELYVAHVRPLFRNEKRTLENLYLKPLFDHVQKNGGKVYPNHSEPFFLMIDFKNGSEAMFDTLNTQLSRYAEMLTTMRGDSLMPGAVTVFLSGSRPADAILEAEPKYAFLDGRPSDIGGGIPATLMPVISDSYRSHFRWRGCGTMPEEQQQLLEELADAVHAEGKKLRLWASPDNKNAWETFRKLGIDLINTDRPRRFKVFMDRSE